MLLRKISSSNYPQQRAAPGLHCDTWKHGTLTHGGMSQERLQQCTMNATLSGQQNPSNSRGETVSSLSIYPRMNTVQCSENTTSPSHKWNKTIHVPQREIMTFLCQQKWTQPGNCTAVYSMLITPRAQPRASYCRRHFLKVCMLPTIHWKICCPSLGF